MKKKNHTKQTLQFYWQEARERLLAFILIVACVVSAATLGIVVPLYYKRFFDILALADTSRADALVGVLLIIGALELARWALWRISTFISAPFEAAGLGNLANKCFAYLHKHSFSYFNNNFVGSLVKRVNWFTRAYEGTMDKLFWNILPVGVNISAIIIVLIFKQPVLALAIVVWTVLFLAVNWIFTSYKIKFDLERNEAESKATAVLADTITNNSNVKLFVGYDREVTNFGNANDYVIKLRKHTWKLDNIFDAMQGLLVVVLQVGIFFLAIYLWKKGTITVGDFVLIQTYIIIIFESVWGFGRIIRQLYTDLSDADEMTAILLTPHEINDAVDARELKIVDGKIVFDDVDFNYNETRKIIQKMNLTIQPHEKVALVGPSGAGKSTIVKLLLRMHDVTGGKILIDGQSVTSVSQESLWSAISLVPQDPILFHRTLMENIRYGKPDATDDEVVHAAKLAHCHEFIEEFQDKYQTFVGERGVKLSGGERQRVAIARAILRNAPILILDEATSSLDSESEHLIQDALNTLMKNKTVIVIAHRLSTIMEMDRIMVVNHGAIVEEGTHDTLLQKSGGIYAQLWKRQAGGFMQDEPAATADEVREDKPLESEGGAYDPEEDAPEDAKAGVVIIEPSNVALPPQQPLPPTN